MAGPNRGMPATHRYTQADLRPTLLDPRCDPKFPLANYWPVYLGNFWCDPYTQHTVRIQEYFGSKGLLVRMVFGRNEACDPYFKEQSKSKCYDFLVYFVAQQDANDAIYFCNRDLYYGHRLNVLPGRMPVGFDVSLSVKHTLFQPEFMKMSEQVFENFINRKTGANVTCVVRHTKEDFLVQYASLEDRNQAIQKCQIGLPGLIDVCQAKQRFLEQNVEMEVIAWIQNEPRVMEMLPPHTVLQALLNGYPPHMNKQWETAITLPSKPPNSMNSRDGKIKFLRKKVFNQALRLFGVRCSFAQVADDVFKKRAERREERKQHRKEAKEIKQKLRKGHYVPEEAIEARQQRKLKKLEEKRRTAENKLERQQR